MRRWLWAVWAVAAALPAAGQTYDLIGQRSLNQVVNLANSFGVPAALYTPVTGVRAYRMTYQVPFLGNLITVSGAVFEPKDLDPACVLPVHIYMHGTVFERDDVPSFLNYEGTLGYLLAGIGHTVLMPDYVGLGVDNLHLHPYVHAESEAAAGAHMLAALHASANPSGNLHDPGTLFLSGYSQGGHAAMSLHRELQTHWPQFPVTASAPLSGPYDISGTQFPLTFTNPSYSNPSYLAYVALAWQQVYGNLYTDLAEVFAEPYASALPGLFDGATSGNAINNALPPTLGELMAPGALEALFADGSPFLTAAQDNDVYAWVPEAPMQLYYCTLDEQVFYQNAEVALAHMESAGAPAVTATNGGPLDHSDCAGLAIFGAALWFSGLAPACTFGTDVATASPAPASPIASPVRGPFPLPGAPDAADWAIADLQGRTVRTGRSSTVDPTGLPTGLYLLRSELAPGAGLRFFVQE